MKKHIFKNILNTFIYIVALFISVGVICFCGWLVYFCLNEYFSHTCCNDPCKDANYIVAAVTALVGIAASVISFVSDPHLEQCDEKENGDTKLLSTDLHLLHLNLF